MRHLTLMLSLLLLPLGGCRTLASSSALGNATPQGVVYHLPKKFVELTAAKKADSWTFQLESLKAVPDPDRAYVLDLSHRATSSDEVIVELTPTGLLQKVSTNSKEESPQIIVELAKAARAALPSAPASDTRDVTTEADDVRRFVFDPLDTEDVERLNSSPGWPDGLRVIVDLPASGLTAVSPDGAAGIVVRRNRLVRIDVQLASKTVLSRSLVLPDPARAFVVPLSAGPFVATSYELSFDDGLLTKMTSNRPSELLGFVSILPDTAERLVGIPAEILQLKIDTTNNETELLEAQRALLEAQRELEQARKKNAADKGTGSGDKY